MIHLLSYVNLKFLIWTWLILWMFEVNNNFWWLKFVLHYPVMWEIPYQRWMALLQDKLHSLYFPLSYSSIIIGYCPWFLPRTWNQTLLLKTPHFRPWTARNRSRTECPSHYCLFQPQFHSTVIYFLYVLSTFWSIYKYHFPMGKKKNNHRQKRSYTGNKNES